MVLMSLRWIYPDEAVSTTCKPLAKPKLSVDGIVRSYTLGYSLILTFSIDVILSKTTSLCSLKFDSISDKISN